MADDIQPVPKQGSGEKTRTIFLIGGTWVFLLLLSVGVLEFVYLSAGSNPHLAAGVAPFPQPQLVTAPESENHILVQSQKKTLQTSGWIDRNRGIAHIPIGQAMQLDLQRKDPYAPIDSIARREPPP